MRIEELNIIISDIEDMLLKSVYINVDIDNNISPRMEFGIQLYETFPNTNPDVPNPLHHLNDVKVNFFFYNNLYDTYMLSELTALDIFKSIEKVFGVNIEKSEEKRNKYNAIKLRELRNYNIDQLINKNE
jgi:hypothetical protein